MTSPVVHPSTPRVAVASACAVGEGVLWDHRTDTLLWVANQTDDLVSVLSRVADHGAEPVLSLPCPAPACVLLLPTAGR